MFGARSLKASFLLCRARFSTSILPSHDMEPYLQVEFTDILTLSPTEQRAGLERLQEEISIGKSDIALLEKQQREEITRLEERHRGERALLDAKQRDLEEKKCEWEAALNRIVFPVLTIPPEIVSRIFILSLPANSHPEPSPMTAPLLVSQICQHWRHIAMETSELWASLYISAETRQNTPEFLEGWLRCAKGFPLSLYLDPNPRLAPSPISFWATYSTQLHSLSITLLLTDVQDLLGLRPRLPILRKLHICTVEELEDDVVIFKDRPALLELSFTGTISTSNLGIYPTLTRLVNWVDITATELHDVLRACPQLLELSAKLYGDRNSQRAVVTHYTLEIFNICDETGEACILDSLSLPSLRKLMITIRPSPKFETLIHFLERSSCPLRYLEVGTCFVLEEWQKCLNLLPCLESLVFDGWGSSAFFAAAASPLVVPLLSDLKVTTEDNHIDYSSVVEFLTSRHDAFHSLEINLECWDRCRECYNPCRECNNPCCHRANDTGIAALMKHSAEISAVDNTGVPIQWIYLAKQVE
ncbi:hypothetical protein C8J57DRAFT_1548852 [Mycena rebaudengoi]|nr:hypothetical protein C8J57DRAFT_1548852 [Mycena rebaudengoi]